MVGRDQKTSQGNFHCEIDQYVPTQTPQVRTFLHSLVVGDRLALQLGLWKNAFQVSDPLIFFLVECGEKNHFIFGNAIFFFK